MSVIDPPETLPDLTMGFGESMQPKSNGDPLPAADQKDEEQYLFDTFEMLGRLKNESRCYTQDGEDGSFSIEQEMAYNASRYLGNHDIPRSIDSGLQENYRSVAATGSPAAGGLKRASLSRTQNSILANTSRSMQDPIYGKVEPVEIGAEDVWYLTPKAGRTIHGLVMQRVAQEMQRQTQGMAQSVTADEQAGVLMGTMDENQMLDFILETEFFGLKIDQILGNPPENGPAEPIDEEQFDQLQPLIAAGVIKPKDIIAMTDRFVAQNMQTVCDLLTDDNQMPMYWLINELNCNIFGFQCGSFDWFTSGEHRHNFQFDNVHPLNVFTDPSHMDIRWRTYHIEDRIQNIGEAASQWPDKAEQLRTAANEGRLSNANGYDLGGISDNVDFGRMMVRVTVAWVRHQQVPLSVNEAVEEGFVVERVAEDGTKTYVLPGTETVVEPQENVRHGTRWPNGPGLRQIICCEDAQIIMQDIRCPHWDIPRVWNLNIPRPDMSPYGQGEPIRLRNIDQIIDRSVTIIINHLALLPFSTYFWPADTLRQLRTHAVGIHLRPNVHIPIPRAQWQFIVQNGGFDRTRHNAPPIPTEVVNLLDMFLKEHDNASNNVDVAQGRAPYAGASGKTISELKQAATSSLSIKSAFLEFSVERFYKLLIHAIVNFMPEHRWAKMLNRYKLPVIREIIRRASLTEWNITVKVSSGRGQDEQFRQDRSLLMYDRGLKSKETTMEDLGEDDPAAELKKIVAELMPTDPQAASQGMTAAPAAPPAA